MAASGPAFGTQHGGSGSFGFWVRTQVFFWVTLSFILRFALAWTTVRLITLTLGGLTSGAVREERGSFRAGSLLIKMTRPLRARASHPDELWVISCRQAYPPLSLPFVSLRRCLSTWCTEDTSISTSMCPYCSVNWETYAYFWMKQEKLSFILITVDDIAFFPFPLFLL